MQNTEHITIGKFILDNLTTGMYNDPLCIYREYVQNAADAIDKAATDEKKNISTDYEIRITLDSCFREARFNSYNVGEIHIVSQQLTPNGRRDDFQDCEMKSDFYHSVADIGTKLSQQIRTDSKQHNIVKPLEEAKTTIKQVAKQIDKGFVSESAKKETLSTLQMQKETLDNLQKKHSVDEKVKEQAEKQSEQLGGLIDTVKNTSPSLRPSFANGKYTRKERETIQLVLDAVRELYDKCNDKDELVNRVIDKLNRKQRS